MNSLQQLQDSLEKGFYVDNLYLRANLCKTLALESDYPALFFVTQQVLLEIARDWEGRPLTVDEAKSKEGKIIEPLRHAVKAIRLNASKETLYCILDDIVITHLTT